MKNGHNNHKPDTNDDITTVVSDQSRHAAYQGADELGVLQRRTVQIAEKLSVVKGDTRYAALMDLAEAWRTLGMGAHDYARGFEADARKSKP